MNHYIKTILLISTLVLLLSVNLCEANELEYEIGEIHYRIENNKAVITNYTGNDKILFIPKQLNGYEVAKIDSFAFANNNLIWTVILSDSIIEIGEYAFYMSSLRNIVLPYSLQYIGVGAFSGSHLTSLYLPPSVTDIGEHICRNCFSLRSVKIEANISILPEGSFFECINLYDVQLPDCLEMIGFEAFYFCIELESIEIPQNTNYIDETAFFDCKMLMNNPAMKEYVIYVECDE